VPVHSIFYGVPAETICDLCGVSLRQARAYKTGKAKPSPAVVRLVTLHVEGRILGDEFAGWSSHGGDLIDPEGHRTTQAQLRAYAFVWDLARELARNDPVATAALDQYANLASERLKRQRKQASAPTRAESPSGRPAGAAIDGNHALVACSVLGLSDR
jgi:hypothetical protein